MSLAACGSVQEPGERQAVEGFAGLVAADEPQAAVVGRDVLSDNGSAADAAVAMGFAMGATMPSRANPGGGGVCVSYLGSERDAVSITFLPQASGGSTPAPAMSRGLALLHALHGASNWEELLVPVENLARRGVPVSRAFARDINEAAEQISEESQLGRLLRREDGSLLREGDKLVQPGLAGLLGNLRRQGVGYSAGNTLATLLEDAANRAQLDLSAEDVRSVRPLREVPQEIGIDNDKLFLPAGPFVDRPLRQRLVRSLAEGGADATAYRGRDVPSAGLVVADRFGSAVACEFSMGALFGKQVLLEDSGIIAAEPVEGEALDSLTTVVLGNQNIPRTRLAVAAGGGDSAGAAAHVISGVLERGEPLDAALSGLPGEARRSLINTIYCPTGATGSGSGSCRVARDAHSDGLSFLVR